MKLLKSGRIGRMRAITKNWFPKVRYSFVMKNSVPFLILMVWKHGKVVWSKHFQIAEVDSEEGIKNDLYDKRVDEFFKLSSK